MNAAAIHKVALVCKDFSTVAKIDNLFILAGANPDWYSDPNRTRGSQRMDRVYGWVQGISGAAEEQLSEILSGVAMQLVEMDELPQADRSYLRRAFHIAAGPGEDTASTPTVLFPSSVEQVIDQVINGLPRAMRPLRQRRMGLPTLAFDNEYDLQTLLHVLLRPWIKDIRPEEPTPSLAGRSTRMDLLLAKHKVVIELKYVRDPGHGRSLGQEIIVDVAHYKKHQDCELLWVVVYDPNGFIENPSGLTDLAGISNDSSGTIRVRLSYLGP